MEKTPDRFDGKDSMGGDAGDWEVEPTRVPDFPGECKSMPDRLLFPSPCTQGEGWVGVDRYGVGRGSDLPEPLAKNPHLYPPPGYMGRRKRRLPGKSGTLCRASRMRAPPARQISSCARP
jgi:hypothetical protein